MDGVSEIVPSLDLTPVLDRMDLVLSGMSAMNQNIIVSLQILAVIMGLFVVICMVKR